MRPRHDDETPAAPRQGKAHPAPVPLLLDAAWTDDCQGKKDYDGDVLSVSTRYWPATYQQNRQVSAKSDLHLHYRPAGATPGEGDYLVLASAEFEADTFDALAPQVEEWAQRQMDRAVAALIGEFGTPSKP